MNLRAGKRPTGPPSARDGVSAIYAPVRLNRLLDFVCGDYEELEVLDA